MKKILVVLAVFFGLTLQTSAQSSPPGSYAAEHPVKVVTYWNTPSWVVLEARCFNPDSGAYEAAACLQIGDAAAGWFWSPQVCETACNVVAGTVKNGGSQLWVPQNSAIVGKNFYVFISTPQNGTDFEPEATH